MRLSPAPICLLVLAVLAIGGCRSRLPVTTTPLAHAPETVAPRTERQASGLAAFLDGSTSAEQKTTDPLGPFLAEVKPDRMQDMVRMDLMTDERQGGPFGFLRYCACVCVPGRDH